LLQKLLPEKELGATYNTVQWYKQVWLDNHSLMLEQHLTADSNTRDFLVFLCKMLELTPSAATVQIISEVFFKICALSGEVGSLLDIFLKNTALINGDILDRYVLSDPKRTFSLLFHQQPRVRDFASNYLERVLLVCYASGEAGVQEKVVRFIQEYLNALHGDVAKNWLRIDGYFKLFEKLAEGSLAHQELYHMFVNSDLIAYFIDFIMEKQSPLNVYQKKYSLGTKSNPVAFGAGLNVVLFLLKRVSFFLCSHSAWWVTTSRHPNFREIRFSTFLTTRSAALAACPSSRR
jgi:ubiquitin carboxyl-terminal hydrolase 34